MRIGYPCINQALQCKGNRTFRLASYSEQRLREAVTSNLDCLKKVLQYNADNAIYFFRISSDIVPFASHPVNRVDWQNEFEPELREIGKVIGNNNVRISMHPDQFTLLNAKDSKIVKRSIKELLYHAELLDSMGLDTSAKIQIHVGGVYGDKSESIKRFSANYALLPESIKRRLVIENDDISYTLKDCLSISENVRIPVLFDVFHHQVNCSGESISEALKAASATWRKTDGVLMVDYSSQLKGARKGAHALEIDIEDFRGFLKDAGDADFDIMLEIKDKEKSALKALKVLSEK